MRRGSLILAMSLALAAPRGARANGRPPATVSMAVRHGNSNDIIVGTTFGSLWSDDHGATWFWLCEAAVGSAGIDPKWAWLADGTILATTFSGLSVSRDNGCVWSMAPGTEDRFVMDVEVRPAEPQTVLVAVSGDTSEILRSIDGALSFGESLYTVTGRFITGVRIAPGAPEHIYAVSISHADRTASVIHSANGGAMWDEWPFTFPAAYEIQLHAVDPSNPAVVFVSAYSPNTLFRSENFGQSFDQVLATEGYVSAFVMSADGSRAWVSAGSAGLHRSDDGGHSFLPVAGAPHAACLARDGSDIYACASNFQDDYVLGRTADGETFEPVMSWFNEIDGPLDCAPGTDVSDNIWCEPQWPALQASFGSGRLPDAGTTPPDAGVKPSNGSGCGCSTGAGGAAGAALAFIAAISAWFGRRFRRRP